ncbi:uncharacterized protein METZ01_LOCUS204450 [marine metagenome]|uniref:DUF2130 domain-containing protein n=1 Tax=marine metagenome TaxID=408172 RepID=A0A382ELB4_9ZZZZ
MSEPTITCPNCKQEIKLTESLAAPLVEATRNRFEHLLAQKDIDVVRRENEIDVAKEKLANAKKSLDDEVSVKVEDQLIKERTRIIDEETKKAKKAVSSDLAQKEKDLAELQAVIEINQEKLAEAQSAQANIIKKERELDDARREIELTVEKGIRDKLIETRERAKREAEESLKLNIAEKDQTISSMQSKIEDLMKKADQGSQQLQGEVQELELEENLRREFSLDVIEPVPKGEFGGDVVQRVVSVSGQPCGMILWESKRTKNWNDGWLPKLREDQRAAKADIAVIVSQSLPKGLDTFQTIDGVCVTHPRLVLPVATLLRQSLIEVAQSRQAIQGQQAKTEMVYDYLTSSRFRQRIEAIVEAFSTMQTDLEREKKVITKQWAKRDEQINRVMKSTVGMYGDLQGIAGKSLQEIESLEMQLLEVDE